MTTAKALFAGCALIAAAILLVGAIRPAEAQRTGPFQIERNGNPTANSSVFRLDTSTGEVSYCYIGGNTELMCTRGVR